MDRPSQYCEGQYCARLRLMRWIGLDHNPLRRRSDRIQAALRMAVVATMVVMLPIAIVIGFHVASVEGRQAHDQAASRHQVNAMTTAAAASASEYYQSRATAPARWTDRGVTHTAVIDVDAGTDAGTIETIWVDANDRPTTAPLSAYQAIGDGIFIGLGLASAVGVLLVIASALVVVRLNRRREAAWESEWERIDPGWAAGRRG